MSSTPTSTVFEPVLAVRASMVRNSYRSDLLYSEFNFWRINSWKINLCSNGFNQKSTRIIFCLLAIIYVETGSWLIRAQPGDVHENTILVFVVLAFVTAR